jgi:hypothetical protein
MPLDSGTLAEAPIPDSRIYPGSMADAMEQAFREEWPKVMIGAAPPASSEQLNMMFRAIAQGVIRHLKQNCESMKVSVTVNVGGTNYSGTGTVTDIIIS